MLSLSEPRLFYNLGNMEVTYILKKENHFSHDRQELGMGVLFTCPYLFCNQDKALHADGYSKLPGQKALSCEK